jgi:hypothetical protein
VNLNSTLWNSGSEANKEIARKQKRKLSYIANVLIVSDPKHPENEGKVFLFKFGKKIFDKIMDKARPTFEDEKPVNVLTSGKVRTLSCVCVKYLVMLTTTSLCSWNHLLRF